MMTTTMTTTTTVIMMMMTTTTSTTLVTTNKLNNGTPCYVNKPASYDFFKKNYSLLPKHKDCEHAIWCGVIYAL
jgi:hypothetical protein